MSYVIVDDDAASRRMLQTILENAGLGEVIGTAKSGSEGAELILKVRPDVVLIDLLMPDQDGIETIGVLKAQGYTGKFVMISQVVNKEMVGQAYQMGIEFFIHKPINKVEVEAVLERVSGQLKLDRSLSAIRKSLAALETGPSDPRPAARERTVREIVQHILLDMGIGAESGGKDIAAIMEYLVRIGADELPPLKDLYEAVAAKDGRTPAEVAKEGKAIEQRIRRTVASALANLASLGLMDYGNPKFEHYAPLYFDFQDVRMMMKEMDNDGETGKGKVNIKKFLQVFYMEVNEKLHE
ncbi:histidine kinase [Gordoniibacillus kamchatkensis]|uniref:Histidine kinase n=1 Tax=Gordoniibacillus kamchatkensis TaxID=1590651 RepID=A0ABR5AJA8_9BACL|nr:histidine kinase [Paenibacillus sp. VKM B-2647]